MKGSLYLGLLELTTTTIIIITIITIIITTTTRTHCQLSRLALSKET